MPGEYLTTAEAAAHLGIKRETLYAYVSRGAISRLPAPSGRGSLFRAEEVAALAAQRGSGQRGRGSAGRVVMGTGRRSTFSAPSPPLPTASCGIAVTTWPTWSAVTRSSRSRSCCGRGSSPRLRRVGTPPIWVAPTRSRSPLHCPGARFPPDRLRVFVAAAAAGDNLRADLRPEAVHAIGRSLLAAGVEVLADGGRGATVAERLGDGWAVRRNAWVEVIDAALVLLADHELATSTMAVRVAASVRADPYHALLAGLATMSGALHGSA